MKDVLKFYWRNAWFLVAFSFAVCAIFALVGNWISVRPWFYLILGVNTIVFLGHLIQYQKTKKRL
jgi:fatty acid desaturase